MGKGRSGFRVPKVIGELKSDLVVRFTSDGRPLCGVLKVFRIEEGVEVFVICHSDERAGWEALTGIARIDDMTEEACSQTGLPFGIAVFDMDAAEQFILKIVSVKRFLRVMRETTLIDSLEVSDKVFVPAVVPEEKAGRVAVSGEGTVTSILLDGVRYAEGFIDARPVGSVLAEVQELADKMKRLLLQVKRYQEYFPEKKAEESWYAVTDPISQLTPGTRVRFKYTKPDGTGESDWCFGCLRRSWNQVSEEMVYALQHDVPLLGAPASGSGYSRVSVMRFRQTSGSLYCTEKELPDLLASAGVTVIESSERCWKDRK